MTAVPQEAVWVRLPRFIGDAVMMGGALETLRLGGRPLVAWGPDPVAELFAGSNWFDAAVGDGPVKPGAAAMAKVLRVHRPAALVNFPRSARGLAAGLLARVPVRLGWSEAGGRWLCTSHLRFELPGHQGERYRALLEKGFGGTHPTEARPFQPRAEAIQEARRFRQEAGVGPAFAVVGLSAAAWIKRLGTRVWEDLVPMIRSAELHPVLLGGTFHEDRAQAEDLRRRCPGLIDFCGRTSLAVSAAMVAEARLVVANDSALAHLGAACGTPTVTVFGPTDPSRTEPQGPAARSIRREDLDCLGCLAFDCRRGDHACMQALPADRIWAVCEDLRRQT